jgi:hypothetical protein
VVLSAEEIASPTGEGSGEPFLSSSGDTLYLSWLEATGAGAHELRFTRFNGGRWGEPSVIASGSAFFVNWADFPSITAGPDGTLWAHWLERGAQGGYDYGIRIVRSHDGGRTWSEPWTPHDDGTATEHGFVSTVGVGGGVGFLWLDGRQLVEGRDGAASDEMALYYRTAGADGSAGPETVVDARVCDCCQTDLATTSAGPVAVYRDRSPDEIRDIRLTRLVDGEWTPGVLVHEDGWETAACPVNGPSVAAREARVAVAWFTGAGDVPRVNVAFSHDAGLRFDEPVVVDGGNPAGRADILMLDDGGVLVSWLERTGGDGAEVRVRYVAPDGRMGESASVSTSSAERASGFPRLVRGGDGTVLAAWTDVASIASKVRVARIHMREGA